MSKLPTLWINGRFLSRPVTGVERVAREIISQIAKDYADSNGILTIEGRAWQLRLITPKGYTASPWPNIPLQQVGPLSGHAWEQTTLAFRTAGQWLLNLCNTGPLIKRRQLTFLHDAQPFAIPGNFSFAFRSWYQLLYRSQSMFAKRILVNSKFTARELHAHVGLSHKKVVLCPLGINHQDGPSLELSAEERLSLPKSPFLLAVSSANPNKNFSGLLRALELMGRAAPPCVIVGQQNQHHFSAVKMDSEKISHLGYVSDAALVELYRRATALAFPSFYEGFGLPPLEAMGQGCAAIVSDVSAMPEVCGQAALYCNPSKPETIARAIDEVFSNPSQRQMLAQQGKRWASRYTWSRTAAAVIKALPQ